MQFDASYSEGYIYILNTGNVHIYQMKAQLFGEGNYSTETLNQGWPAQGLGQGATFYGSIPQTTDKIVLIPVLIGHSNKGDVAYTCEERQGYELII